MSSAARKLRRTGSKSTALKQAAMAAEVLTKEAESASRALMMHAAYHAACGPLGEPYLKALWAEMQRVAGQRNMSSKEFFEKGVQCALSALRDGVKPFGQPEETVDAPTQEQP